MRRWLPAACAALVLTLAASTGVRANVAPPQGPREIAFGQRDVKVVVEVDEKAKQPRLVVPANLIGPQVNPGAGRGAGAQLPTIMAGLALTAAFATGGFWFLRKGAGRGLVMLFVLSVVAASASVVHANRAPPPPPTTKNIPLPAEVQLNGNQITLEVVPRGDAVVLIMPKDAAKPIVVKPQENPAKE
jgi:hypothetical protein